MKLIFTTGNLNTGPDITEYYGTLAHVFTKRPVALFSRGSDLTTPNVCP